jgi:recombination protein RecT
MAQSNATAPALVESRTNLAKALANWKGRIAQIYGDEEATGRLFAVADACVRRNPDLGGCTLDSFRTALEDAAVLGLLPTGLMNLGHIVPFRNKRGTKDATFIAGYRGLLDICYRSQKVAGYEIGLVHIHDDFEYVRGLQPVLRHNPEFEGVYTFENRAELRGGYAIWWDVIDGNPVAQRHIYLTIDELERLRMKSKKPDSGPWKSDYHAMIPKTIVRASTKLMPLTPAEDALLARTFEREDEKIGLKDPVIDIGPDEPQAPQETSDEDEE